MRQEMVNHKESETEFSVLQHQDNMKRIAIRTLRYFYGPIEGTPFSLGLALPEKYGLHELYAQQEIRHSQMNGRKRFDNLCSPTGCTSTVITISPLQ